jgi:signal transduction histidine kinase
MLRGARSIADGSPPERIRRPGVGWTPVLLAALVAGAMVGFYAAGALLGFRVGGFAWPFWPANGLACAVLVRRPAREWPLYAAAQLAGELAGGALIGAPLHLATGAYAVIDAGESLLAAALIRRGIGERFDLRALPRVARFIGASLLAVVVAAAVAAGVAAARGSQHPLRFFATFAVGDLLGFAVVAPAALRLLEGGPRRPLRGARAAEALGLGVLLVLVTLGAFLVPWPSGSYALVHAVIPVLAWCAIRLGTAGGSFGVLLVAAAGAVLTPRGLGPFALLAPGTASAFAAMQLFLAFVAATALLFAAAVAERRAAAVALAQAARAEAVGTLAGAVAHDLRNFVTVILSGADSGKESLPPDHPLQEDLATVRQAALSADRLAHQVLALAREGAGVAEVVDLGRVARETERLARHLVGPGGRFTARTPADGLPVLVDRVGLERVIFNLVANARAAIRPGGEITMEVDAASLDGADGPRAGAVLRVRDDGEGMTARVLERAFEPFFTTRPPGRGTGLGLAGARAIVERAGGTIRIVSEPGRGTVVSVMLPLAGPGRGGPVLPDGQPRS